MASIGDVVQLRVQQNFLGVDWENVYYYRVQSVGSGGAGYALAGVWHSTCAPLMLAFQSELNTIQRYEFVNLADPEDFGTRVFTPTPQGDVSGEAQASFYAITIKLFRDSRIVRNGYKRIGGIPESQVNGNSVAAGSVATVDAFAESLDNNLSDSGWVFQPVIYGRPTGEPNFLPERIVPVVDAQLLKVSTQRSRLAST